MNSFFIVLLSFVVPTLLLADEGVVIIQKGEKVYYHSVISNKAKPTLILLPGIFRGLNEEDEIIQILKTKKINYVAVHFSGHPSSVQQLDDGETAIFAGGRGLTSEILAQEVEAVVLALNIKNPVPVSLSYSTTVVPFLNRKLFPLVIETAPLAAFGDGDPEGTAQRKAWADWLKLWPGNYFWLDAAKDKSYRDHWAPIAADRATDYENVNADILADGYIAMARATENFDLRQQKFNEQPRRIWIFAENELESRRQMQDEAVKIYNNTVKRISTPIIIANSGHTIPSEQPKAYAQALVKILAEELK